MSGWQLIETAPKDRRVDLWAKRWRSQADDFVFERFPDCRWDGGDRMCNRSAGWSGIPKEYCPTHWMEIPGAPT